MEVDNLLIDDIIEELRRRDILLVVSGDNLSVGYRPDALTEADAECIKALKIPIMRRLLGSPEGEFQAPGPPEPLAQSRTPGVLALPVADALRCSEWQRMLDDTQEGSVAESYARECVWLAGAKEARNRHAFMEHEDNICDLLRLHNITPIDGYLYFENEAPADVSEDDPE